MIRYKEQRISISIMEKQGENMKMTRNQCIGSIRIGTRGATAYMQCRNSRDVDYNISSTAIPIRMRIRKIMEDEFYYHEE